MFEKKTESNGKNDGRVRKADIGLISFFLILALAGLIWSAIGRADGRSLRISCDGQVLVDAAISQILPREMAGEDGPEARYCLIVYLDEGTSCEWFEEEPDPVLAVPAGVSYNLLAVSGSGVSMSAADCPDQICVHHIPIAGGGESIICLPHKLAVELVAGTGAELWDGMAQGHGAASGMMTACYSVKGVSEGRQS